MSCYRFLVILVQCRLLGLKKMGGAFFSTRAAALSVACCWSLSIIINGPQFFWADVEATSRSQQDCKMPHIYRKALNIYYGSKSVITFFIPLTITWMSYCSIIYRSRKTLKMVT